MLHRLIIVLIRIVTNTFFRRIDIIGAENIPEDGPVIFAGNHPNALMDGWLLTATCGRWPLHFVVNAKLWHYRILVPLLNACGAVPVYRREEHDGEVDNQEAFAKLYEVIEAGKCMGIFPEGISHTKSRMVKLKTGAARIALTVTARGNTQVRIVPCGLNYMHRHRFRSQVLIEFGAPIVVDEAWVASFQKDEQTTVTRLTDELASALAGVTLNAPDWRTLRFIQTARRLYKPSSVVLSPGQYVELNRRFLDQHDLSLTDPELREFQYELEDYQSQLDMLGLKDYQLRQPVTLAHAFRKILGRALWMLALLPLAIPGALLHLPVGWIAATVGERFSYEMDDVATLKVFATILLLPVLYIAIAIFVSLTLGVWWAIAVVVGLALSFSASVRIIEAEAGILVSMMSVARLARLDSEVEELRATRAMLVTKVRALVDKHSDPAMPRMFTEKDFDQNAAPEKT
jgi:glycerol-3-phosphate O-acyltransferase/dihydroxyacetone phosphate acyltransferase